MRCKELKVNNFRSTKAEKCLLEIPQKKRAVKSGDIVIISGYKVEGLYHVDASDVVNLLILRYPHLHHHFQPLP